jgi:hypothetical protein
MLLMIVILAGRMTRGDYLGGKGFRKKPPWFRVAFAREQLRR